MSDQVKWHAAERVDLVDLDAQQTLARDSIKLHQENLIHDRRSLIVRGFRIELPDQTAFPGRITVHGGVGWDSDGQMVFTEDQLAVTRTITLEGAQTDFYVEIEFTEGSGSVDARAFWDSTVDQGLDVSGDALPDGQEFSNSVSTRDVPDWRIVQPVATTGFARDSDPTSTRIPLAHFRTDSNNQITGAVNANLTTEKAATTLLQQISSTRIQVQNPQLMPPAGVTLRVGEGAGTQEDVSVVSVDRDTGIVVTGPLSNSHTPGEIVRAQGASAADFVVENDAGLYRVREIDAGQPNHQVGRRDVLFRGDEIHGDILQRGHGGVNDRSDVNIQALKDYVDYLAAQVQEMKWGISDPHTSMTGAGRTPPGVDGVSFPTTPRHYDRAGGVAPSRMVTITVGDGTNSFGDFNGATETSIQAAHDNLPAAGGRIFIKKGTYVVTAGPIDITNAGTVIIESEKDAVITSTNNHWCFEINGASTSRVILKNLDIQRGTTVRGLRIINTVVAEFQMHNCRFTNARFGVEISMPYQTSIAPDERSLIRDCMFIADHADMASLSLVATTATGVLSGKWENCQFDHSTANGVTGTSIDCTPGASVYTVFSNCDFFCTSAAATTSVLDLGGTVTATIEKSRFGSVASLAHIRTASGSSNVRVIGCDQIDTYSGFLVCVETDGILVDGFRHAAPSGFNGLGIQFQTCNRVKVVNCDFKVNSILSGIAAPVIFTANTAAVSDLTFSNNSVEGDITPVFDKGMGVFFDSTVANNMDGIVVSNNRFHNCEIGVGLRSTDASAGSYINVTISDNIISDTGVSASVANNLKLGILADASVGKTRWSITGNQISNLNPANTNTVLGETRAGILILGTCSYFTISNNTIQNIGSSGNELVNTGGIRLSDVANTTITGNVIQNADGVNAFGISLTDSGNFSAGCTVSGNKIDSIDSTTGFVAGINTAACDYATIIGNQINAVATASGSGAMIHWSNATSGLCQAVTIGNNSLTGTDSDVHAIWIQAQTIDRLTIQGNVASGTFGYGIVTQSSAGGSIKSVTVSGNSVVSGTYSLAINFGSPISASSCERFTVFGNTFFVSDADAVNIIADDAQLLSITGNHVENSGAHTAAGRNIYLLNSTRFVVLGNVCRNTNNANSRNIELDTSTHWDVVGNLCDVNGGSGTSIKFDASGIAANQACGVSNIVDTAPATDALVQGIVMVTGQAIVHSATPY
jgi:parallel beta-helix repeat protein